MSNMDATRVMGAAVPGGGSATIQMPAGGDAFRTQMGGTTTCPVCKSTTPLLDIYCGDCGYLLNSPTSDSGEAEISHHTEEAPAAELVDEQTSRRYRLRIGVNTVGRQGTDILSTEGTVSRNHATITVSESGILVEDLGSSNGTKVGDNRLQPNAPVAASAGDTVRFGTWKLVLVAGAGNAASPADRTILASSDDKTVVIAKDAAETAAAEEDATAAPAPSVEEAPAIAHLKKLEGICDDIRIPEGMISLGRKSGNAIVLADPYLSGRHAEIFAELTGVFLIDVGSTNGTLVNGQRLEPNERQVLLDGDEVQLGQTKYRFVTVTEVDEVPVHTETANESISGAPQNDTDSETTENATE